MGVNPRVNTTVNDGVMKPVKTYYEPPRAPRTQRKMNALCSLRTLWWDFSMTLVSYPVCLIAGVAEDSKNSASESIRQGSTKLFR